MFDWFNVWERVLVALPLVVATCATVALMSKAEEHARQTRVCKVRARYNRRRGH